MEKMDLVGSVNLDDFLLCTPYEKRNDRDFSVIAPGRLTEKFFFEKLYSPPSRSATDTISGDELRELGFVDEEINTTILHNIDSIEQFRFSLSSKDTAPLFVRGYSGTGKTTFVRTFLYEFCRKNDNYHSVVLNMQDSQSEVYLFNGLWENKKYSNPAYKLDHFPN